MSRLLRHLRVRMILSHILPILVLTPTLILVLVYLLETRNSVGQIADQLIGQAGLIVQLAQDDVQVWSDPAEAQKIVDEVNPSVIPRIMILDKNGNLLASSLDADLPRVGKRVNFAVVNQALVGQTSWQLDYSPAMGTRILDMAMPVVDKTNSLLGIVRLSYDVTVIEQTTVPLSGALAATIVIGTILALALSLGLARSLNRPLTRLTSAISSLTPGLSAQTLPEVGPDEIRIVAQNYNRMVNRLDQLEQSRKQLVANIVHELGTPLGAIKAASEALRNGAVSDQMLASELAFGIGNQIDQLQLLVDDLALLGESEIKDIILRREWCDLKELIQAQCRTYAYWVKQKSIELTYNIKADLPPVFVDSHRLGQILANLLHNAYKYCPAGSCITVSADIATDAAHTPTSIVIEVADNGPGIAIDEQAKIFDLLYRSPNQRNMHKGMGIGLAISKRLAEAHGGSIAVDSTPGKGTVFVLTLPFKAASKGF